MARITSIRAENGHLRVRFEGRLAHLQHGLERLLTEHCSLIATACREHDCFAVLMDMTAVEGSIGVLEEHLAACVIIERWPPRARVAMVPAPGSFPNNGIHLERVARNRGADIRLFGRIEQAAEWLETGAGTDGVSA